VGKIKPFWLATHHEVGHFYNP